MLTSCCYYSAGLCSFACNYGFCPIHSVSRIVFSSQFAPVGVYSRTVPVT